MKFTLTITVERTKPADATTQAVHPVPAAPSSALPPPTTDFRQGGYA